MGILFRGPTLRTLGFREIGDVVRPSLVLLTYPLLALLLGCEPTEAAQSDVLDSAVVANSRVLRLEGGRLTGIGADFLAEQTSRSQFVAIGEEHNTLEIPALTTALLNVGPRAPGFDVLVVEQDPVAGRWASEAPSRGTAEGLAELARQYPHGFTFVSDQELHMLADAGRRLTLARPVWGCDQAFGVTHILDRLLPLVRDEAARSLIDRLRTEAVERERTRDLAAFHFMSETRKQDRLAEIRDAVTPAANSESADLIESLLLSDRIYGHYVAGRYYANGFEREEYMKRCLLDAYRRAEQETGRPPRVLLKFGHWHLYRGLGPSNLQTLGDFASQFAVVNGRSSFHLAVFPHGAPDAYGDLTRWSDPTPALLARTASTDEWTVIDLRALRPLYRRLRSSVPPEAIDAFRRWIFGYDAALIVGGMRPATYDLNPGVAY